MLRHIAVGGVVCLLFAAWLFRYELTPAQASSVVYRLDRWTGEVSMIGVFGVRPLKPEAP